MSNPIWLVVATGLDDDGYGKEGWWFAREENALAFAIGFCGDDRDITGFTKEQLWNRLDDNTITNSILVEVLEVPSGDVE